MRLLLSGAIAILCSLTAITSLNAQAKAPPTRPASKPAGPAAEDLLQIGGRWSQHKKSKLYYYRDTQPRELFSYHMRDSNKDGIANLRISHDRKSLIILSQGYPNHPTAVFPNTGNPNRIAVQKFRFQLPLKPVHSNKITRLPMGPVGVALNGVVFFNPFERGGMNAVAGYSEVWLDSCCGHPQETGVYHYHKYPSCVKSPFSDDGNQHSPVLGYAFDGYAIYGPYESKDTMAMNLKGKQALDVCNGHTDPVRGYHYHVTPGRFPYIIGGYHGVPERSNNFGLSPNRTGAIQDNARGKSNRIGRVIKTVLPGNARRGAKHEIQIELNPQGDPAGVPAGKPAWMQIGPYEASKIARQGNRITGVISIPADAAAGVLLDCHIEFKAERRGPRGTVFVVVYKKSYAFRVVK